MGDNRAADILSAESLRVQLRRLIQPRDLYVIPRETLNKALESGEPDSHWSVEAIRELGRVLHADAILEIRATSLRRSVRLDATLIRGGSELAQLDPIEGPTVGQATRILARRIAADRSLQRRQTHPPHPSANER